MGKVRDMDLWFWVQRLVSHSTLCYAGSAVLHTSICPSVLCHKNSNLVKKKKNENSCF
jgi:hypothetical protein